MVAVVMGKLVIFNVTLIIENITVTHSRQIAETHEKYESDVLNRDFRMID